MMDREDWNASIIREFRENEGRVGGMFEGAPLLLLHTTGAKSGIERVNPLMHLPDDGRYVVIASKGGAPTNPDWYHNVIANPEVSIEVGAATVSARARVAEGEERDRLYARQAALRPQFAEYQANTHRVIPVVVLEPVG
jgi:deazaflavin-dependent oxidoreductase (nitroreductase family)